MKSSTRRPERRNRKIGTAASGRGRSNKMVIPNSKLDRFGIDSLYQERIKPAFVARAQIGSNSVSILYEEPRNGFTYGCSPKDVVELLSHVPAGDCDLIDLLVFRQPTKKQMLQAPVWGRMQYAAVIGDHVGPTIYLEAQKIGAPVRWTRKLCLDDRFELNRLREDGHLIVETKREFVITPTENSIRNTMLYRTVLHELGHWKQYEQETLNEQTALFDNFDLACDLYFAKPRIEREQFAHRYAFDVGEQLRNKGIIPFEPFD